MFGIFKRKNARSSRPGRHPLVEVTYGALYGEPGGHGYVFIWKLRDPPQVGHRVFVRGNDGRPTPAVVIKTNATMPAGYSLDELADVQRLATTDELVRADAERNRLQAKAHSDAVSWLNMARRAAGLPTPGRARSTPPEGYAALLPARGTAPRSDADKHGRAWWKAMHLAQKHGRPADEVAAYRNVARYWFSIRDKGPA